MTTKHEIEIPDLPDGYRPVSVSIKQNDRYRNDDGTSTIAGCDLIIEKIKPSRIVLEDTQGDMPVDEDRTDWIYHSDKWWRIVEEE